MIRVSVCRWGTVTYKQRREPEFEDPKAQRNRLLHKPLIPFLKKRMTAWSIFQVQHSAPSFFRIEGCQSHNWQH